jgi:hypothetical protein
MFRRLAAGRFNAARLFAIIAAQMHLPSGPGATFAASS